MLVKPENLRGAANICSDGGKRPLAAMFKLSLLDYDFACCCLVRTRAARYVRLYP